MYNKSRPNIVLYEHFFLPFRLYVIIWTGQKKSRNKVESSFIHSDWMSLTLEYIDIFEGKKLFSTIDENDGERIRHVKKFHF